MARENGVNVRNVANDGISDSSVAWVGGKKGQKRGSNVRISSVAQAECSEKRERGKGCRVNVRILQIWKIGFYIFESSDFA